jgi:hypothetical protein
VAEIYKINMGPKDGVVLELEKPLRIVKPFNKLHTLCLVYVHNMHFVICMKWTLRLIDASKLSLKLNMRIYIVNIYQICCCMT